MVTINIAFIMIGNSNWVGLGVMLFTFIVSVLAFVFGELSADNPILPLFMLKTPYSDAVINHIVNNMNQNTNMMVNP